MQKEISTAHGGTNFITSNGHDYSSLYASIFSPNPSVSLTPSDSSTDDTTTTQPLQFSTFSPPSSPRHSSLTLLELQDLVDRHNLCLSHLREAAQEADSLRRENTTLRVANRDLNKRLSLLVQSSIEKRFPASEDYLKLPVVDGFRGLCIGDHGGRENGGVWEEGFGESPTSVMESDMVERGDEVGRVSLPKSISVRSNGYLKTGGGGGSPHGGRIRSANRVRTASQPNGTQKVYVHGGRKKEEALELEVYNQGMFKTELCNKWQETGTCPYGDNCQFAHGLEELRPVIRHPRYKTEVCRMVLAGDHCPYGHRCHFRHALTEQEKLIATLNPRALKLGR